MDNSEPNTLTEKDIVEVAKREYRADDPTRANRKFRDLHNGKDALTDIQRLRLHHLALPPHPSGVRLPIPRIAVPSVYTKAWHPSCQDLLIGVSGDSLTHPNAPGLLQ